LGPCVSIVGWVGLGWVKKNGPTPISGLSVPSIDSNGGNMDRYCCGRRAVQGRAGAQQHAWQRHVESRRSRLNTDFFCYTHLRV